MPEESLSILLTHDTLESSEPTNQFRWFKKKSGEMVLQQSHIVNKYEYGTRSSSALEWIDVPTVEED